MSKLVLHIPGGGTRDIKLDRDRITIGRRADNDVHLPYPAVSAEHAAIITVLDDSFLEDLQSTNGTLVNGKRVTKHFLRDHDAIDVGRVQLVYVMNDDEVVEPLAASEFLEAAQTSLDRDEPWEGNGEVLRATQPSDHGESAPVENLLAEMMSSSGEAAVAIDFPSTISFVRARQAPLERAPQNEATAGVYLEVMSGPNAGQIAPMTKREFVLGRAGMTRAVIRRDGDVFSLVPVDVDGTALVNGKRLSLDGVELKFGDAIEVAGVVLRFGRRSPL